MRLKSLKELVEEFGELDTRLMIPMSSKDHTVTRYGITPKEHPKWEIYWLDQDVNIAPKWAVKTPEKRKLYAYSCPDGNDPKAIWFSREKVKIGKDSGYEQREPEYDLEYDDD